MTDYITPGSITPTFFDFFQQSRRYNQVAVALTQGELSLIKERAHLNAETGFRSGVRHGRELLFVSLIDNFQCYLVDILYHVFAEKPEILSEKSTKNSIIFRYDDLDALKKHVIDVAILELAYKSISDLDQYFESRLGVNLVDSNLQKLRLTRLIQIRNIISHNRGKINHQFISKCGAKCDRMGQLVGMPRLASVDKYLISLAESVDRKLIAKFGINSFLVD